MAEFAERMKELRSQKEYTMDYVVTTMNKMYGINLTRSHISRYENGQTQPSIVIFSYFCKFYGVSADYLLGLVDEPQGKYGQVWNPAEIPGPRKVQARAAKMKDKPHKLGGAG